MGQLKNEYAYIMTYNTKTHGNGTTMFVRDVMFGNGNDDYETKINVISRSVGKTSTVATNYPREQSVLACRLFRLRHGEKYGNYTFHCMTVEEWEKELKAERSMQQSMNGNAEDAVKSVKKTLHNAVDEIVDQINKLK